MNIQYFYFSMAHRILLSLFFSMLGTFMPEFIYPSLDVKQSKNRRDTLRWDRGLDCAAIASHRLAGRDLLTYLLYQRYMLVS